VQTKDVASVVVAGASLHLMDELKSLGVVIDSRLIFATHALAVRSSCNYHINGLCNIYAINYAILTLNVVKQQRV